MPSHLGLSFYPYLNRDKPCHVIAYNCANTRMSVLKKLFLLGNYEFGKEHFAPYPMNYLVSPKKIKFIRYNKKGGALTNWA